MTIQRAKKILSDNGIFWGNYFDLRFIENARQGNWIECEQVYKAIQRIKKYLTIGV